MFEFRTAASYLVPRKGQLSTSVVGIIAIVVITAITWLILVFFSTTEGFESRWSQKIIGVVGPMRVVPTPAYFDSPFYQLDLYSNQSSFTPQRLSLKARTLTSPYDSSSDPPLPQRLEEWQKAQAKTPHPIAALTERLDQNKIPWRFFESTVCHLSIPSLESSPNSSLSQYSCLLGLDSLCMKSLVASWETSPSEVERLLSLLRTPQFRASGPLIALASSLDTIEIILSKEAHGLPQGKRLLTHLVFDHGIPQLHVDNDPILSIPLSDLSFSVISASSSRPFLALAPSGALSFVPSLGYPVLLPKQMRQHGTRLLDTGTLQFTGAGMEGRKELSIPFYVAGFFDSGILPVGSKLAITSRQAVLAVQPDLVPDGPMASSGIIIDDLSPSLQKEVDSLAPGLFSAERYDQYDVTKELYQQLASEKNLFRLLSLIIIVVACSNVFSMLFILAHDRRRDIAVLRALGSSRASITAIFLMAGLGVGLFGSLLGSALASATLHYLPQILGFIGGFQGHAVLNQGIYGDIIAQSLSLSTELFAFTSICCASALAGALAAIRACTMNVSEALKS